MSRRRSGTRFRGRPSTATRATTSGSPAPACWRCAFAASRASGPSPDYIYFGGNSEMRGYDYLQFIGQNVVFANAELRFPIIEAALTPIGVIGGIRGVFFANIGGGWFNGQELQVRDQLDAKRFPTVVGYQRDAAGRAILDPVRAADSHLRPRQDRQRLPPEGRPRVVRPRPRDVRARLPDSLRLGLADALQQGVGRRRVRRHRRQHRVPQAAVLGLDWLRLLVDGVRHELGLSRQIPNA